MDNAYSDRSRDIWTSFNLMIHLISLSKMLFHLNFTEETVQLRLMVGKMLPWCQSSFFFLENFPARERDRVEISSFSSNYEKP